MPIPQRLPRMPEDIDLAIGTVSVLFNALVGIIAAGRLRYLSFAFEIGVSDRLKWKLITEAAPLHVAMLLIAIGSVLYFRYRKLPLKTEGIHRLLFFILPWIAAGITFVVNYFITRVYPNPVFAMIDAAMFEIVIIQMICVYYTLIFKNPKLGGQ